MTNVEFEVIGELKDDPGHFLLLDDDGQCYDYDLVMNLITPVEVDTSWMVDVIVDGPITVKTDSRAIAS